MPNLVGRSIPQPPSLAPAPGTGGRRGGGGRWGDGRGSGGRAGGRCAGGGGGSQGQAHTPVKRAHPLPPAHTPILPKGKWSSFCQSMGTEGQLLKALGRISHGRCPARSTTNPTKKTDRSFTNIRATLEPIPPNVWAHLAHRFRFKKHRWVHTSVDHKKNLTPRSRPLPVVHPHAPVHRGRSGGGVGGRGGGAARWGGGGAETGGARGGLTHACADQPLSLFSQSELASASTWNQADQSDPPAERGKKDMYGATE